MHTLTKNFARRDPIAELERDVKILYARFESNDKDLSYLKKYILELEGRILELECRVN